MEERTPETGPAPGKTKKKSSRTTVLLVLVLLLGVGIMAYPTVSDWWNSMHATQAIAAYSQVVEHTDEGKLSELLEAARAYNDRLSRKEIPYEMSDEELAEYKSLLDVSGDGIMGYVQVPSLRVNIPIYHTTDETVLQIAVGHLEWTSLPIGGESTHAVLSGHRGLPSAKLFTDLDKMREGDLFTITVLNQTITYQVDQIRIVEPGDVSELSIVPGEDYCTLVTCTPYGINTHRLLVRGHRTANEQGALVVAPEAVRIPNYITIPAVGIPLMFLLLLGMLVYYRVHRRKPVQQVLQELNRGRIEPKDK
ncbi:MAG: class C sortase [Oscillospiraceae bacterium]|nr:class C sortase [Oscillospiraceae bacterium]